MAANSSNSERDSAISAEPRFAAKAWTNRERVADSVSNSRQNPVNMIGLMELTNDALRAIVEPLSSAQKLDLAKQLGYESLDDLLAGSTAVTLADGSAWCLTIDRSGAWAAWNIYAINSPQQLQPHDEAVAVRRRSTRFGSPRHTNCIQPAGDSNRKSIVSRGNRRGAE